MVTHVQAGWQRQARVVDLGLGGACIAVEGDLRPGDVVTLSFIAPTLWDPLLVRARVAWSTPGAQSNHATRAGVAFEHKNAAAVYALFELVAAMAYE
jgi:hypothetical protein